MTVPTPSPARKVTPVPGAPRADRRDHQRAVRHVGIVARILDDAGPRPALAEFGDGKGESGPLPAGQARSRRGRETRLSASAQIRRLGRRRRAGARGPATAQRSGGFTLVHAPSYNVAMNSNSHLGVAGRARRSA